jgi:putative transcriptional regulator
MSTTSKARPTRDVFQELVEGMSALAEARQGKRTLRTHAVALKPAPQVTPRELMAVRRRLKLSRALFAACLRTNVRTLENWEQGRAPHQSGQAIPGHGRASRRDLAWCRRAFLSLALRRGR